MTNLKDRPFALVGVHVGGGSAKDLKALMAEHRLPWRSFVDPGDAGAGPIAAKWTLAATPTFYLLDHAGVIRHKWAGPPGAAVLDAAVDRLIATAERDSKPPPPR